MRRLQTITLFIALAALAATVNVSAHPRGGGHWRGHGHWHGHVGLVVGIPLGAALYSYSSPQIVSVPAPQVVYVEQNPAPQVVGQANVASLPAGWWYYCANPAGYYPYVQSCTQPWQPVEPRPPTPR